MEKTNKKECPKCKSSDIFDTGDRRNDGGNIKPGGGYQEPYRPIYKCRSCGESFIFDELKQN